MTAPVLAACTGCNGDQVVVVPGLLHRRRRGIPPEDRPVTESAIQYNLWSNKHQAWWCAADLGYSKDRAEAGLYTEAEAIERVVRSSHSGLLSSVTCMVAAPINWGRSA